MPSQGYRKAENRQTAEIDEKTKSGREEGKDSVLESVGSCEYRVRIGPVERDCIVLCLIFFLPSLSPYCLSPKQPAGLEIGLSCSKCYDLAGITQLLCQLHSLSCELDI